MEKATNPVLILTLFLSFISCSISEVGRNERHNNQFIKGMGIETDSAFNLFSQKFKSSEDFYLTSIKVIKYNPSDTLANLKFVYFFYDIPPSEKEYCSKYSYDKKTGVAKEVFHKKKVIDGNSEIEKVKNEINSTVQDFQELSREIINNIDSIKIEN